MMQKLSDGGVPGEFWDPRDQRYDPQYHARQTLSQQRFHQQVSPPDANHGGKQHISNAHFWHSLILWLM
jgi:hypothetical protein